MKIAVTIENVTIMYNDDDMSPASATAMQLITHVASEAQRLHEAQYNETDSSED